MLDLGTWNATHVLDRDDTIEQESGWTYAFRNVSSVANNGKIGAKNSPIELDGVDGPLYIGFDLTGNYGVLLEDSMDRVFCLNHWRDVPAGRLYTLETENLDDEGLAKLANVTEKDKWLEIVAAIVFFGNIQDEFTRTALQATIWHYSDDVQLIWSVDEFQGTDRYSPDALIDEENPDQGTKSAEQQYEEYLGDLFFAYSDFSPENAMKLLSKTQEMVAYIDTPGRLDSVDFDSIEVHYYAPYDDPDDVQNLLSL